HRHHPVRRRQSARARPLHADRRAAGSVAVAGVRRAGLGAGPGGAMKQALRLRICALVLALLPSPAAAHVLATGLAAVSVDGAAVTYRLTLVPAELPPDAAATLTRAASGERAAAERIADALRRHVVIRVAGEACRPGRVAIRGSDIGAAKVSLEYALNCT